jgi:DNA (cytosine-5)-methyltransferase 1
MGIEGEKSGVIRELFRLISDTRHHPRWVILENVPFMLSLDKGKAMEFLVSSLEEFGYNWAYRVIDANAFGIPQRRRRVFLVASPSEDPREVLFSEDLKSAPEEAGNANLFGFYWSEGNTRVGWAVESVPKLYKFSKRALKNANL